MSALPLALLRRRTAKGLTIAALAIAATLATLALAAAILLDGEAGRIDRLARGLTIAISDVDPAVQAARSRQLTAMLRRRGDLEQIRPAKADTVATMPGGGDGAPAIVEARLRPGHDEIALGRALAGQPGIAIVREGRALDPLAAWLRRAAAAAMVLLVAALATVVPMAMFGVRAMLGAGQEVIELLRRLGADDRQIAGLVRGRVVREALVGGLAGLAAAAIGIVFIAAQGAIPDDGRVMQAVDPWSWTMLLGIPPLVVGLACIGAELAARGALPAAMPGRRAAR